MTAPGFDVTVARAHCDAATPGPWRVSQGGSGSNWIDAGKYDEVIAPARVECMAYCYGGTSTIDLTDADAEFIAFFDPPTVRSMLDLIEAQQAALDRVKARCEDWQSWGNELESEQLLDDIALRSALSVPPVPEEQR